MEYFILRQDSRITPPILPADMLKTLPPQILRKNRPWQIDNSLLFTISGTQDTEYPAFMDRPVFCLVNKAVKDVFCLYNSKITFTPTMLNDKKNQEQHLYWLMDIAGTDCLAAESEFFPTKKIKKIVLDIDKIRRKPIFKIGGILDEYLVIRLDVAESLLRRDTIYGIDIKPVLTNR
jgi:hypothetical protein